MLRALLLLLAALGIVLLLLRLAQRRLIYFPLDPRVGRAAEVLAGAEDVSYATEDGLQLGAWFVPAPGVHPRATVLVFPGNAGNRALRASLAAGLRERGMAVLLVDYRGYGGNPGRPTENGLLRDARAARRYVLSRPDVDPLRLVYFGESLGAAVALGLAVEAEPALLVLRSPFTTLADVARVHYPFLPVRWLLVERYPSLERVARLAGPLLVVAGGRDSIVPPSQSRALFDAARSTSKRLVVVAHGDHNDGELVAGRSLIDACDRAWSAVEAVEDR